MEDFEDKVFVDDSDQTTLDACRFSKSGHKRL